MALRIKLYNQALGTLVVQNDPLNLDELEIQIKRSASDDVYVS